MPDKINFYRCDLGAEPVGKASLDAMLELFAHLRPVPTPHPLIRIGDDLDGSYLIPDDLEGITACFSPGVNNFKNFEDAMVERYGMRCHMCDFTSDADKLKTPLIDGMQTFEKKWLDIDGGADSIRLDDWVARQEPDGDLLLQMDIEGAEYRNLLDLPEDVLKRFRIIVLEVHGLKRILRSEILKAAILPFFEKLSKSFANVHAHPNNCCGSFTIPDTDIEIPVVLELTYLRRDRMVGEPVAPVLPHPLDVGRNVDSKPPMFLGNAWFDGERPASARMRMLEVELDHAEQIARQARQADVLKSDLFHRALGVSYAGGPSSSGAEREVARGKPFWVNHPLRSANRTGVVEPASDAFFQTKTGLGEFIRVDLRKPFVVSRVRLTNRIAGHFDRAASLFVIVSPTKNPDEGQVVPVPDDAAFLSGERRTMEVVAPSLTGRYVFVMSAAWTNLHLSNIEVFAAR